MKFFKQHSYDIVKLFINQIGIAIFGLVLTMASAMMQDKYGDTLGICVSVFSVLFYLYLVYVLIWDLGAKDKIRIDAGRLAYDRFHGFKLMLFAQIPSLFFAALLWLGAIFMAIGGGFFNSLGGVFYSIGLPLAWGLDAMYLGLMDLVFNRDMHFLCALLFTLTSLPALGVCALGYVLGVKDIRFLTGPQTPKSN